MLKRYLAIFVVALTLAGCAGTLPKLVEGALSLPPGALTESVDNPITRTRLAQIENGLRLVVAGLRTHKRLCERAVLAPSCVADVEQMQGYVRQGRPVLAELRRFVKTNDQVNARIAFETAKRLFSELRSKAIAAGVPGAAAIPGVL